MQLLHEMNRLGTTVLVATHNAATGQSATRPIRCGWRTVSLVRDD